MKTRLAWFYICLLGVLPAAWPAEPDASIVPEGPHPLQSKIDVFLSRQQTWGDFQATGLTRDDYLRLIAGQVKVMREYQDDAGRIIDPVEEIEKYYATPCYAHCVAVLAASGYETDAGMLESGIKALEVSLADMVGATAAGGHGDFYTWPVMLAYELFEDVAPPDRRREWKRQLREIRPRKLYRALDASGNWNVVNLSGEYLRSAAGLTRMDYVETMLPEQLVHFTPLGMYSEHGNPMPYDLFPRHYLAGMLQRGYRGEHFGTYRDLLWRGAWTSLLIQSPTGQLSTGYRSSHHIWNEAQEAVLFEIYAAASARAGRPQEAAAFKRAARLSLGSVKRWIRPDGSGYIVKNRYPIEARHGYESYSAHTCYNLLACSMLAQAWQYADETIQERPAPADVGGYVLPILQPFHKIFATAGGTYAEYDTRGDQIYNPTGLIRVHLKGGHPQLGPSDGCAPKFSGPGVHLAIGPEWHDATGWHRLAELTPSEPKVEILEETPERTRFRVHYEIGPTCRAGAVEGKFGQAIDFADPSSSAVLSAGENVIRGDYAISIWFRPKDVDVRQALLAGTLDGRHAVYLELADGSIRFVHRVPPGNEGGTELRAPLDRSVSDGWHHLAATKGGSQLRLIVDGQPAVTAEDETRLDGPLQIILANLYRHSGERHFGGAVDELRLYNRELSPLDVQTLSRGKEPANPPLAHWTFDEAPKTSRQTLTETITVEPAGVTIEDELRGATIDAMRVTYPMLVFDGLKSTNVDVAGNSIQLEMDGRGVSCTILEPPDAAWVRSAKTVGHRNGLIEPATAEIQGVRAVYRIAVPPDHRALLSGIRAHL